MNNSFLLLLILLTLVFFYLLLPGLGALMVRRRWRKFREDLIASTACPLAEYGQIRDLNEGSRGLYRFIGSLQAIDSQGRLWISREGLSVSLDLQNSGVFLLPALTGVSPGEGQRERSWWNFSQESLEYRSWKSLTTLPEGTQFFIYGELFGEAGQGVFRKGPDSPFLVILFDGPTESLLPRSLWGGRQKNEYWNHLTPVALAAGFLVLLTLGYLSLRLPFHRSLTILSLWGALLPNSVFFPPGLLFYWLYRRFWTESREHRAERDMISLCFRYFPQDDFRSSRGLGALPSGEEYAYCRTSREEWLHRTQQDQSGAEEQDHPRIIRDGFGDPENVQEYFCFGRPQYQRVSPEAERAEDFATRRIRGLLPPRDPMADYVVLPGNPRELHGKHVRDARRREWAALTAFLLALASNGFTLLILLSLWFR